MKNKTLTLIITALLCIPLVSLSQDVPPPPPPGHGTEGNVPGGGAPIGGGLFILLGIGSVYGGYKGYRFYQVKKKRLID